MRLLTGRRMPPDDEVQTARARVAALGRRSGWVPRVPDRARRTRQPANPHSAAAAGGPSADRQRTPGRHAKPPEEPPGEGTDESDVPPVHPAERPVAPSNLPPNEPVAPSGEPVEEPVAPKPRGPVAAAVADRLPLLARPLVEGLPAGVRRGRLGLQPSHALIIVLVVLLGLAVTALLTGLGRPKVETVQPAATATVLATGTPIPDSEPESDDDVVVHVVGKVGSPGIVELPAGSRVVDALEAVGGAEDGVDLSTLNLARVVGDGEQIFVGVDPPPQAVTRSEPDDETPVRVNLNTATAGQLETLPGIGPTLAGRILEWRERHGRFTAVEELLEVSGIGPAKLEAMAELVTR